MKIGVISDTHGNIDAFGRALEFFEGADLIVHAGDVLYHPPRLGCTEGYDIPAFADRLNSLPIPVIIAQGNCDPQVYEELLKVPVQAPYAHVVFERMRIVVNHGHLLSRDQMVDMAARYQAHYFICGHTHVPVLERLGDRGVVLMNPGSPSIPKYEVNGRPAPSVGLITDDGASIIDISDGSVLMRLQAIRGV